MNTLFMIIKPILLRVYRFYRGILRKVYTLEIKITAGKYGNNLTVNYPCRIGSNVFLGENTNFNGIYISEGGNVFIGNNFHSGKNVQIIVEHHNYEGSKLPYDETYIHKNVIIEDNVWLGNNVIILGGVTIGEGAIIQAGSVVSMSIPPCAVAGGNPAKPFMYRDINHYEQLKEKKIFL